MGERYYKIIELDEIPSTNDYAFELVKNQNVEDFTTICTNFQSKGRGQIGNCWVANKGENLLCSVILHPTHILANNQFIFSEVVALAVQSVVAQYCKNVKIKWPNDIYVNDNKIAGILIENNLKGKQIETSIIGLGLNINQTIFQDVPNPTSLQLENNVPFHINEILTEFLEVLRSLYKKTKDNKEDIHQAFLNRLYRLGEPHTFRDDRGEFIGTIISVENDGRLKVVDKNNFARLYNFKEIEYCI